MNVANYSDGCGDVDDIALFHEQFFCFGAYCFDQWFSEELLSVKLFDTLVEVDTRCDVLEEHRRQYKDVHGRPGIAAQWT